MSSVWTVRRSATDAKIGGVCGGVAEQWAVDPVLVRVGAVLLGLSGGIGVVLYAAAWLMIPVAGETRTHLDDFLPQARRWPRGVKIVIVAAACVIGASLLAPVLPFGFGSALVLAAIWYFGYYKHRSPRDATPGAGDSGRDAGGPTGAVGAAQPEDARPRYDYFTFTGERTAFTQAAQAWQERMREYEQGFAAPRAPGWGPMTAEQTRVREADRAAYFASPDPVGLYSPTPATSGAEVAGAGVGTAVSTRRGRRGATQPARRLRLVGLIVLGLTMSALAVASRLGVPVGPTTYLAAALLVCGLTLVAAAWVGRARGILPVALLLAVATTISAVGGTNSARDGVGIENVVYTDSATIPAAQQWTSGSLTVDLSRLRVSDDRTVSLHVDSGTLTVVAPAAVRVRVVGKIDDGLLKVGPGRARWGSDLTATSDYAGTDPTGPVLTVEASVDQGLLEVRR
ncbi:phage shock protein PspC (stress-responsive transcriptional regulator) [Friedmanniella endophytica]|uniref:Phage shock protein PspC (Stress-responsive transcriptional regulator) n=1 Tax=Microlunatus kandeliicorticis TaxID=1759536 RepID=A0A7W3IQ61_9ACTN|nr:PspC domain-containing protein [Microlunatus kandeliicorticis]MBA8793219.1 phage shock protein PspC (stress-responsive transcriptional regulator) [Microlunatus kandeliicorticis]